MMIKGSIAALCLFLSLASFAQIPVPAPTQQGKTLILNGTAHIGTGEVITNSAIAFENGKLLMVIDAGIVPPDTSGYDQIIHAEGKHIYPGFIAPNSQLGLQEIGQVRASHDFRETGLFLPNVRSAVAYNTDSKVIPTVRSNGVLMTQVTPTGGYISGTSSIMQLDAWNWEDAMVRQDDGVHLNWPNRFNQTGWWAEPGEIKPNKKAAEQLEKIRSFFEHALAYSKVKTHAEKNLRYEAMRKIFAGEQTLFVHVNRSREMLQVINFVRDFELKKVVIVGGYDAWMVADQLKDLKIAVMLRRVHRLPMRKDDDVALPYKLPAMLDKAGVLFCLQNAGDMAVMQTRNLPFYAGTAVAYGLDKEKAVQAITLNAAIILGIDKQVGSLEKGKDATLFISSGDALDVRTNNVEYAFIQGRNISLDNHQKQLYRKFSKKLQDGN